MWDNIFSSPYGMYGQQPFGIYGQQQPMWPQQQNLPGLPSFLASICPPWSNPSPPANPYPAQPQFDPMAIFMMMNQLSQLVAMLISLLDCEPQLPVCPPPPSPPVSPPENKIMGSAGLFGDPKFGLFSPQFGNVPEAMRAFESGIRAGHIATLLQDPDHGGLTVKGTGVQVNPLDPNSHGIGEVQFAAGSDRVLIKNNGDLLINNVLKGNISTSGLISPITLANGAVVSTAMEADGTNGATAERFVVKNGDYKITAVLRKPHADSQGYFDVNFEELVKNAADNAVGYRAPVPGLADAYGIPDLLRLEPGDQIFLA